MALPRSPVLSPLHGGRGGGGVAPLGGTLVAKNPPPLYHACNRKDDHSSSSSSSGLIPTLTGLRLQKGTRRRRSNSVVERRPLPPMLCFGNDRCGGSRRDDTGVEDEDADIEELLARSQRKLVVDVRPLQETRREEEAAFRKGREMLFRQFCLHLGLTPQELRAMWWARGGGGDGGGAEERLRLVRDLLGEEWGWRFRPLSPRAAVEMLDEHIGSPDERAAAWPPPHNTTTITTTAAPRRCLLPNWRW